MKIYPYLIGLTFLIFLLASCGPRYAYYQTPFQANTSAYKTIPLQNDSNHAAVYASGVFTLNGANHQKRDGVYGFTGSIYRSHSSEHIQGYYGFTGTLGGYRVNDMGSQGPPSGRGLFSSSYNHNLNDSLINTMAGNKFYGGWGATGGINLCIPFDKSEWRILGVEASWQQEFGDYLKFRKNLPDTAANLINRKRNTLLLGINTDLIFYTRKGSAGYKLAFNWFTDNMTLYNIDRVASNDRSFWISQTIHITEKRVTGFGTMNWGSYALGFQVGVNYRLGR